MEHYKQWTVHTIWYLLYKVLSWSRSSRILLCRLVSVWRRPLFVAFQFPTSGDDISGSGKRERNRQKREAPVALEWVFWRLAHWKNEPRMTRHLFLGQNQCFSKLRKYRPRKRHAHFRNFSAYAACREICQYSIGSNSGLSRRSHAQFSEPRTSPIREFRIKNIYKPP